MVGKSLSHYKILEELGRGGMGIVYKAEDTKLDRTVAIKVLPSAALASEDDRARFYREAKAAAQLHHPHIASVFEIDEAVPEGSKDDDLRPLISMEFIEGETLHDRIQRGPLKLEEVVRIASQVASGLEAAHEKEIVHRDLKSQNVMLTEKGQAKILDFGLAQTAASTKLTRLGSTLGTVAYMSPEQARGEEVDLRTDLWSLGVVLYEMIAGRSPFPGDYEQAVVYEILNQDPEPPTSLRTGLPLELERIVLKCLMKDQKRRYQHADELIADLTGVDTTMFSARSSVDIPKSVSRPDKLSWQNALVGLFIFVVGWMVHAVFGGSDITTGSSIRFTIPTPGGYEMQTSWEVPTIAIAPDGNRIAYREEGSLWLRDLESEAPIRLSGTDIPGSTFFSPDGSQLGFWQNGILKAVSGNGIPAPISRTQIDWTHGVHWYTSNELVLSRSDFGIWRLNLDDESFVQLTVPNKTIGELAHTWPQMLDDGHTLIYTVVGRSGAWPDSKTVIHNLNSNEKSDVVAEGTAATYLKSGWLTYVTEEQIIYVRKYDPVSGFTGPAIQLGTDLQLGQWGAGASYAIAENGTLVYARANNQRYHKLYSFDRAGTRGEQLWQTGTYAWGLEVYPGTGKILTTMPTPRGSNISILDPAVEQPIRYTTGQDNNVGWPVWSPDGERVAWYMDSPEQGGAIVIRNVDKTDNFTSTYRTETQVWPRSWSEDGNWIFFSKRTPARQMDIFAVSVTDSTEVVDVATSADYEWGPMVSPDGIYVAYELRSSGMEQLVVEPVFSSVETREVLPLNGAHHPRWSRISNELFFWREKTLYAASYTEKPIFQFTRTDSLFTVPDYIVSEDPYYDLRADGEGFVIQVHNPEANVTELQVVLNALEELE